MFSAIFYAAVVGRQQVEISLDGADWTLSDVSLPTGDAVVYNATVPGVWH